MDLSYLRIDVYQINKYLDQIAQRQELTRRHVEAIKIRMDALNGMWEGAAHDAEMQQFETEYENMQELCRLIEELFNRLENTNNDYLQCDWDVMDIVHNM